MNKRNTEHFHLTIVAGKPEFEPKNCHLRMKIRSFSSGILIVFSNNCPIIRLKCILNNTSKDLQLLQVCSVYKIPIIIKFMLFMSLLSCVIGI